MKKIFTIIYFALCLSANAQNTISFKKNEFNIVTLISDFFEAKHNEKTKEFIWKPNLAEKLDFGVSSDGYLYTKLDTLLVYGNNKEYGTIVLSTFVKGENGEIENCHACSPSLSLITFKIDDKKENMELEYFKKYVNRYGGWGNPAKVDYIQISNNDFCIKVIDGYTNQGITMEWQTFYLRGEHKKTIYTHEDDFGMYEKNRQTYYDTTISADLSNKTIILTKKGIGRNEKTNQKIVINKTERFKLDENYEFIKICN